MSRAAAGDRAIWTGVAEWLGTAEGTAWTTSTRRPLDGLGMFADLKPDWSFSVLPGAHGIPDARFDPCGAPPLPDPVRSPCQHGGAR
jgi:hypothetical protein